MITHRNIRLDSKVLHDDFLDVAIALMQVADGEQRVNSLLPCFSDTDENTCREGNMELAGFFHGTKPNRGFFVRGVEVRSAGQHKSVTYTLQHEAYADIDFFQSLKIRPAHDAGVGMR